MFSPRRTLPLTDWRDPDGLKLYTISASGSSVDWGVFIPRLEAVKRAKAIDWRATPAFAIFHEGSALRYLVVAWWGNENELFNSVSVNEDDQWIEDAGRYSFCVWDLDVIWYERNSFLRHIYTASPDLPSYRNDLKAASG